MKIFLVVLTILTVSLYPVDSCGTNNVVCLSDTTYQLCFTVGTEVTVIDGVLSCAAGTTCSETGAFICMESTSTDSTSSSSSSTTTASTTTASTTVATGPPETCTTTGKYPADACNQYWECVYVMWWYELVLQTCGTNLNFDAAWQECIADATCVTTASTTTESTTSTTTESTTSTTTESTTATTSVTTLAAGPPESCTTTGRYPADACNQYWECVYVMWWYELVLQTCGSGLAYDAASQQCVTSTTC